MIRCQDEPISADEARRPEFRVGAAAKLAMIRAIEKHGRLPDVAEIAAAIEDVLRREVLEAELAGELKAARQYCLVLQEMMPVSRQAIEAHR